MVVGIEHLTRKAGGGLAILAALTLTLSSVRPAAQMGGGGVSVEPVASVKILKGTPVSPASANAFYGTGSLSSDGLCGLQFNSDRFCSGGVLSRAPELKAIARGLKAEADFGDSAQQQETADRIFEYVRNSIDTEFMFGLHKGALGAMIDRSGTAFDQAQLMVELLRESGLTASYRYGTINLTGAEVSAWTGYSRASAVCELLATGGIPFTSVSGCGTGTIGQVNLSHVWVQATVGGQIYFYDPAYKSYTHKAGLGRAALHSAMGLNAGGARNAAISGMSQGSQSGVPYVASLNADGLDNVLQSYSQGLLQRMNQADLAGADLADVIGGREIVAVERPVNGWRQVSLGHISGGALQWNGDIPDQFRARLAVVANRGNELGVLSQSFFVDEIYGRRLEIDSVVSGLHSMGSYNHAPRLMLDGVPLMTGTVTNTTHLTPLKLNIEVNHPFAAENGSFGDVTITKQANVLLAVAIVHGWGKASRALGAKWEDEVWEDGYAPPTLNCNGADGCDSAVTLRSGDLLRARIGASWLAQFSRAAEINAELGRSRVIHHHTVGVVSAEYMTTSSLYVPPNVNQPTPTLPQGYSVADEATVVDLETSFGMISRTGDKTDRRAAIHALALTAATLEGIVLEQLSQTPDAASTATRFAWGNAPETSLMRGTNGQFTVVRNESPDMSSRRVHRYSDGASAAVAGALVRFENLTSGVHPVCNNCAASDQIESGVADTFKARLSGAIQSYSSAGFDVTASSEALLGPGHRQGPEYLFAILSDSGSNRKIYQYKRTPSLQNGGALIANKYDAAGNPTEIAHVLTRITGTNKGGGGPSVGLQNNAAPGADKLKDQFVDRSVAAGVDLMSGRANWRSEVMHSKGQGEFPHRLETRVEFRGDKTPSDVTLSGNPDPLRRTFVSNWDGTASIAGSGLEAMGASRIQAAAVTIAALSAMQDIYRDAPNNHREVTAALTADWWARKIRFNVVTVSQGVSSEQFVATGDGSWLPAAGGGGKLTLSGGPMLVRPPYNNPLRPGSPAQNESLTRYWLLDNLSMTAIGGEGDARAFEFWSKAKDGLPSVANRYWGFRLKHWVFPSGVTLNVAYDVNRPGLANSVTSNLGVTISAFPVEQVITGGSQFQDAGGRWHKVLIESGTGRSLTTRPVANLRLSEVYRPADLHSPSLRYLYGGTNEVFEARDAIAVASPSARGPHRFFIATGYRGERADPLSGRYAVEMRNDGRHQRYIDEMGRVSIATYDGRKRLLSRTSTWGDVTTFKYDARDNVIEKTQSPKAGCGNDNWWCQTIVIKAEYHPTWNKPTKIILPATIGGLAEAEWTFLYNSQGLLYEQRSPAVFDSRNNQNAQAVTKFWYDTYGRQTRIKDPTGIETTQVWGGGGLPAFCLRQSIASSQSGGLNLTTNYGCNTVGDVTSVTDPRGNSTTATYDGLRRKTAEVGPAATAIHTQWVYDLDGNVTQVKKRDAPANVWRSTLTTYSLTGKPLTVTDPSGDISRTCYDALDRAVVAVDPTGRATRTIYNAASQPTNIERWYTANVNNAACALTNARPDGISTNTWRKYEYNAGGLQSAEIDANGNRTQMTYDGLGRLIVTTFADGAEAWSITDQRGQVVLTKTRGADYQDAYFDQMGRINHIWEHRASDPYLKGRNTRTGYDLAGRPVWKDVSDQPTATWNETLRRNVHIYGYDAAGRPTTDQVQPLDSAIGSNVTKLLTYGYDAAGNRTSITWPDGFVATYAYDAANRPQTVTFGGHTATISHDSLGRRTGLNRSSGANTVYAYKPDNDLLSLTHNWKASANQTAAGWTYVRDAAGRITEMEVSRLDLEWLPTTAYAKTYGPANNLNQVASQAGQALTFNANGNLASFQGTTYTWALGNRLESVTRPGMSATYAYDGEDRRTMKTVDGVITRTLWSGADEVAEMDGAGNILRRFIPDGSGAMDGRLATLEANGIIYWHHTDHQGSVVATSNSAGAPVSIVNYSPNGEMGTALDGTQLTAPPTGSSFGYTGRQYDPETGLWQYRARYYHSQLGQFLSQDPIGTKDDPNLYLYVGNDPVNLTDPTGARQCNAVCQQAIRAAGARAGGRYVVSGVVTQADSPLPGPADVVAAGIAIGTTGALIWDVGNAVFNSPPDLVEDLRDRSTSGEQTGGRTRNYELPGGMDEANEDFDKIVDSDTVQDRGNGVRTGQTADGRNVNVRPNSTDGRPTVEVQNGRRREKFRYGEKPKKTE